MKRLIFLSIAIALTLTATAQVWEKYDNTTITLEPDLTVKWIPVKDTVWTDDSFELVDRQQPDKTDIVSPYLYYSNEVLSIVPQGAQLIVTHKGYARGFEWMGMIVYREIYGVVKGKMEVVKVTDGKYVPPVTIPEKKQFREVIAEPVIIEK